MNDTIFNLTELIRSFQRTEGYQDCFRRGLHDCDQAQCAWRPYCMETSVDEERQDADPNR